MPPAASTRFQKHTRSNCFARCMRSTYVSSIRNSVALRTASLRVAWGAAFLLSSAIAITGAGTASAHAADGHPAKIHVGTCEALGPVAFSLNGVGASVDLDENPIATPQPMNEDVAFEFATS